MATISHASRPVRPVPPRRVVLAVPAAVAAIAIGGALVYARESWSVVTYRLLTDGLIAMVWALCGAGLGAFCLPHLAPSTPRSNERAREGPGTSLRPDASADRPANGLLYFVTSAALGLGMIGLAALGLGLAGLLNRFTAIALLTPGLPLGWLALRDRNKEPPLASTALPSHWHWLWLAAAPFLAVSLIGTMVPPGLIWNPEEPHGYDVVEYHLQVPREWYEAGRIVPLKHNVFSYFPMGVEVHYLLAMEIDGGPWEGMYLAQLMHLSLIVLTVLAAWGVAIQFGANRASATVAAVALATIPWMAQLGAIAYNEGGLLLYGTLAVGWAMQGLSVPAESRSRLRHFALAGAMAGFACGTKLTAVPELLLGVPACCFAILLLRSLLGIMGMRTCLPAEPLENTGKHGHASTLAHGTPSGSSDDHPVLKSIGSGLTVSLVFGIAGLLTFAPWLARNVAWVGNPVFPEAVSIFGKAHLNDVQVERLKRANHEPGVAERGAIGHVRAVWDQVLADWQFGYILLPLGVVSGVLLVAHRQLPGPSTPGRSGPGFDSSQRSEIPVGSAPRTDPPASEVTVRSADPTKLRTSLPASAVTVRSADPTKLPPPVLRGRAGERAWTPNGPRQTPLPNPPPEYRGRENEELRGVEQSNLLLRLPPPALLPALMLLFLSVFWVGFTHLQSRFFLLAGPLAVILIAQVDWGRWLRLIAGLVIVAAVIGWWGVNSRFVAIVWRPSPDMRTSLVDGLGRTYLQWLNPAELDAFPRTPEALRDDPNAHVTLIGDSRAFYYQIPMSRLRYRTIFDLDSTALPGAPDAAALIAAWAGRPAGSAPPPGEWLLIDGAELARFSKTYFAVPPPPPEWADRTVPLVVKPGVNPTP